MSDIDRLIERIRQGTEARMAKLREARETRLGQGAARPPGHVAGARVFDSVTGQEGEVISSGSENVVVPATKF